MSPDIYILWGRYGEANILFNSKVTSKCISSYEVRHIRTTRTSIDEKSSEEVPEDRGIHSTSDILHVACMIQIFPEYLRCGMLNKN